MGSKLSFAQRQLDLFKMSWMSNANIRRTPLDFHTHVGVGLQRPLQVLQGACGVTAKGLDWSKMMSANMATALKSTQILSPSPLFTSTLPMIIR